MSKLNNTEITIPIIKEAIDALKRHQLRSGLLPTRLLGGVNDVPEGVTASAVISWINGTVKTVNKEHLDFVLDLWAGQPDLKVCKVKNKRRSIKNRSHLIPINRMPLSEELILVLEPYRDAGLLPSQIFENAKKVPEGLSTILVSKWLSRGAKTIEKKQFDYVLRRCKALEKAPYRRINITEKMRQDLKDQSERTGIGATALLGQIKGCPEEVSANMISAWAHGHTKTARKDHYEYVLREWKRL